MKFPAFTGWGYSKDFPRPAAKPFRVRWQKSNHRDTAPFGNDKHSKIQSQRIETRTVNTPEISKVNLVGRFTEELLALGGHVIICNETDFSSKVIGLLREKKINRVQTWDQIPGLEKAALTEAGISVQLEADESIQAGITGALAGIAETGTLVIQGGEGQPLSASLLPEVYIAVLRASDIEGNLAKVLNLRKVESYPSVVLVSGPSRTADIEMTLTIGVHGPGELHVFIVT